MGKYLDNAGLQYLYGKLSGIFAKKSDIIGSAQSHNGIFRGKDLTNVYTVDQLYAKVSAGDFDDLYLGDYITVSITTTLPDSTVVTEDVSLMIAAFNYYYNCGDTALTKPHLVLIPRGCGFKTTAVMHTTNTTEGGYLNSYMHKTVLPCYASSLKVALNNHLLLYKDLLTNKISTTVASMAGGGSMGATTGNEWSDVDLCLMNEVQLYGTMIWSSSAYDVGNANRQLPVFKFINAIQYIRNGFWLRTVANSTSYALCNGYGIASANASSVASYVRPIILFG